MINKYLLRTLAVLALAFVIIISTSPHAAASDANSLLVLAGFQGNDGKPAQPVDVKGTATVLGKTASNGIVIPIGPWEQSNTKATRYAQELYKGNHLDTDNNGSTDSNSINWATSENLFGYSRQSWNKLIWCGNAGGVPDGEMQLDVTVGGSDDELMVGKEKKYGKWVGQWWRQAEDGTGWVGFYTGFTGRNARITALNPGLMVVKYTFVENSSGTIETTKKLFSNKANFSDDTSPGNSNIDLIGPTIYGTLKFDSSTVNPWRRTALTPSNQGYSNRITVPEGWRIKEVKTWTYFPEPTRIDIANKGLSCTGPNNTGACTVAGVTINIGNTMFVDWYLERTSLPSVAALSCSTVKEGKNYFTGWGIDKDAQGSSPSIGIYEGGTLKQTVVGNVLDSDYNVFLGSYGYNTSNTTQYNIKAELGLLFHDGLVHTVTPKINELTMPNITFGGSSKNCGDGSVTKYLWPWLQTTNGNVVANGKIIGNTAGDTLPGARRVTDKEVEFLIISKVGGDGPFCSLKNYILTNASATGGTNCSNGSGYSVLNVYSLVDGGTDKVVAGVKAAYDKLGNTCRGETALNSDFATNSAPIYTLLNKSADVCPDGVIIKYSGTSLDRLSLLKGRATILVENSSNSLTIGQNVVYGPDGDDNPRNVPNLAIVVKGNVKVLSAASRVDASIYATGTISTCNGAEAATPVLCKSQLTINGFLSAQSGFIFGRVIPSTTNHAAAEKINLTLQSVLYPPPGIDYGSVFKGDSSVKIDSSEYQPRF